MDQADRSLTAQDLQNATGTADWRVIGRDAMTWFPTGSHTAGAALARGIAAAMSASSADPPDIDIRARGVRVRLVRPGERFTHESVTLARAVSAAASDLGLTADPAGLQLLQIGVDAQDAARIMPFWERLLGHQKDGDVVLRDPLRRLPSLWFQDQDAPRPLRNRLHLDIVTSQPVAAESLAAARELGQVRGNHGYYATVADADGNEADILPLPAGADRWEDAQTEDWRLVFAAMACYPTGTIEASLDLTDRAAALADEAGLDLGIDLRPGLVTLDSGKDRWEMAEGYAPLAAAIQVAARELGLTADTTAPRFIQVGIDAVDIPAVRRFWAAALGYVEDPRDDVTDIVHPHQLTMPVFLQRLDAADHERRRQRGRIHLDLFVPDDQAQARVEAALSAGGRVTFDEEAPAWWTLADPEGNEVCIAVSPGREERWGE